MIKKKFVQISLENDMHVCFYPECGNIAVFDSEGNVVETGDCHDMAFVEVHFYEKIKDEKR